MVLLIMSLFCLSKTLGKTQEVIVYVCKTMTSDWQLVADTVSASF